jgi:hypothetical protein
LIDSHSPPLIAFSGPLKWRSLKRERKEEGIMISHPTTQYLLITIIYLALPLILQYPFTKLFILMELVIINENIA